MIKKRILQTMTAVIFLLSGMLLFANGQSETAEGSTGESLTIGMVVNTSDYKTAVESVKAWSEQMNVPVNIIEENTQTYASTYVLSYKNPKYRNLILLCFGTFILISSIRCLLHWMVAMIPNMT